jgi:hypothetical protein
MNWEAIGAVGEILGALGVIVTLGYLATQIRQNTASNRQAAARSTVDAINRLNFLVVEHPEIIDLSMRGLAELRKLNAIERARFHLHWMSSFIVYQQAFFHAQRFEIERHLWRPIETHLFQYLRTPGLSEWWDENQNRFSPEFVAYVRAGEPIG